MVTINSNKIEYKNKFISKTQKMWNFMRRNRNFRVADLMMIVDDTNETYFYSYINALKKAKYLQVIKNAVAVKNREYRLIKPTGVIAPIFSQKDSFVFDKNNMAYVHFTKKRKELNPKYKALKEMLDFLVSNKKKRVKLSELMFPFAGETSFTKWSKRFQTMKLISKIKTTDEYKKQERWDRNYLKEDGAFVYRVDLKLAIKLATHLSNSEELIVETYWKTDK